MISDTDDNYDDDDNVSDDSDDHDDNNDDDDDNDDNSDDCRDDDNDDDLLSVELMDIQRMVSEVSSQKKLYELTNLSIEMKVSC